MTVTEEDGRIIIEPVVPEVRLVRKDGRLWSASSMAPSHHSPPTTCAMPSTHREPDIDRSRHLGRRRRLRKLA